MPPAIPADAKIVIAVPTAAPPERTWTWPEFTERFAPVVRRFLQNLLGPENIADALILDTLAGFFIKPPRFEYSRPIEPFGRFLLECVLLDMKSAAAATGNAWGFQLDRLQVGRIRVDEAWDEAWQQELLRAAVRSVHREAPDSESFKIFELCTLRGLSLEEVGRRLGIPESSVLRARERLGRIVRQRKQEIEARGE